MTMILKFIFAVVTWKAWIGILVNFNGKIFFPKQFSQFLPLTSHSIIKKSDSTNKAILYNYQLLNKHLSRIKILNVLIIIILLLDSNKKKLFIHTFCFQWNNIPANVCKLYFYGYFVCKYRVNNIYNFFCSNIR